jgi:hypothetical protein
MAEPFFAPGPQLWPAIPGSGFGYFPTIPGSRMSMITTSPPSDVPPAVGTGWPAAASVGGGMPVATPADFATAATPHALLGAVAMRRGQPMGPTNDHEIEDFICDVLDLLPGTNDIEVRCDSGRATLTGSVPHKRLKRDVGEVAWAIPSVNDVQNNITIITRRRSRAGGRDVEAATIPGGRKQG